VTRDVNTPKTLSFSGIIKARSKEIIQWGLNDLGVEEDAVGLKGAPTIVSELAHVESKREVEILTGSMDEKADLIIQKLSEAGAL
jgi:electron transfer flavoprotein beta subunit